MKHYGVNSLSGSSGVDLSQAKRDREAVKKELMSTHYDIGNPQEVKLNYQTSNKMKDFSKDTIDKAALNKNQMDDLRAVHYKLGNFTSNYSTTSHECFVTPVGASRATLSDEVRKDLRAHHFEVNAGSSGLVKSHYADTFQFHEGALKVSQEEIEKKKLLRNDLSACHYKLGCDGVGNYSTTAKLPDPKDFPGFVGRGKPADIDVKSTNWTMGSNKINYDSTYSHFNDGKPKGKDLIGTLDVWEERRLNPSPVIGGPALELIKQRKEIIKKSSFYIGSDLTSANVQSESKEKLASSVGSINPASNNKRVKEMKTRILDNNKTHYHLGSDILGLSLSHSHTLFLSHIHTLFHSYFFSLSIYKYILYIYLYIYKNI